jgi:Holliday junction resolvase RusA-like endonuclease
MTTDTRHGITIVAYGHPRPQPRPRFAKGRVISIADTKAKFWLGCVQRACERALSVVGGKQVMPDLIGTGGVTVRMQFRFGYEVVVGRKPKAGRADGQPHLQRPDTDNLAKLVLDVMVKHGILSDDCVVASLVVEKVWTKQEMNGVTVQVMPYRQQFDPSPWVGRDGYPCDPSPPIPEWLKGLQGQLRT